MLDRLSPDRPTRSYANVLEGAHIIPHHLSEAKNDREVNVSKVIPLTISENKKTKYGKR
jgi:hypothetical protein